MKLEKDPCFPPSKDASVEALRDGVLKLSLHARYLGILQNNRIFEYYDSLSQELLYADRQSLSPEILRERAIIAKELPQEQWELMARRKDSSGELTALILLKRGQVFKPDHILTYEMPGYTIRWHHLGGFLDSAVVMSYSLPGTEELHGIGTFNRKVGVRLLEHIWPDFISKDWADYLPHINNNNVERVIKVLTGKQQSNVFGDTMLSIPGSR